MEELQAIINDLYRVLLLTSMMLLLVLLINNFVFYRRKFKDDISLMILFCFIVGALELAWDYFEDSFNIPALLYIAAIGYVTAFMLFAMMFNIFFLKIYNCLPKKKWVLWLIYGVPLIGFFLVSVSTPWTGLVFYIGETGLLEDGILFEYVFPLLILSYFLASLIVAIYHLIKGKGQNKVAKRITYMLIGFTIMAPLFFLVQLLVLGFESRYTALTLCLALALMFLVSNLNTLLLVDSESKMKAIEADLEIASKIQTSALPPSNPNFEEKYGIALRASMNTAKHVGGDFYDYFPIDDNRVCFLIADVSGKGTPAALFMMTAKTVIKDHASIYDDTARIYTLVNNRLNEGNKQTMFATSWIGIFDKKTMTLQYTNAGHNPPLLYHKNGGNIDVLKKVDGLVLGIMACVRYRSNTIQLEKGDRLLLYTDGVTEAHNVNGDLYGDDRLLQIFNDNIEKSDEDTINTIFKDVGEFSKGAPQFDDITMVSITIK